MKTIIGISQFIYIYFYYFHSSAVLLNVGLLNIFQNEYSQIQLVHKRDWIFCAIITEECELE